MKAYLAADHLSDATGKTIAIAISKNGAAFANSSVGAVNATEIGNGWYYVDLSAVDTGTQGPVVVRGVEASIDNVELVYQVVDPTNLGASNLDAATSSRSTFAGLSAGDHTAIAADAVAGLTAQGYSSARAGYLDTLNGIVAAIWGAAARTLTAFGFGVGASAADVRVEMDANSVKLANLDAAMSSRSTFAGGAVASVTDPVTVGTNSDKTGYALAAAPPTASDVADAFLDRSLAGGANGGRTVRDSLRVSRNKVVIAGTTITVYAEDDVTVAWTGTLTTDPSAVPITALAPA
ncbi:MAG: hypothetical protein WDO73_02775 [Ignavibacteriota bacterium]